MVQETRDSRRGRRGLQIFPIEDRRVRAIARNSQRIQRHRRRVQGQERQHDSPRGAVVAAAVDLEGFAMTFAEPRTTFWWRVEPRAARWWMATPRTTGRTWREGEQRHVGVCGVPAAGGGQIPGLAGYSGCWVCGHQGHRAAECSRAQGAQVESWLVSEIAKHGREWTQVQVQQILAKAEVRATAATTEQQSWSRVVQAGAGGAQWRREKTPAQVEAQKRYAEQRKVRQARTHARQYREKARRAMAAVHGDGTFGNQVDDQLTFNQLVEWNGTIGDKSAGHVYPIRAARADGRVILDASRALSP